MLLEWADVFLLQNVGDGVNGVMMIVYNIFLSYLEVLRVYIIFKFCSASGELCRNKNVKFKLQI